MRSDSSRPDRRVTALPRAAQVSDLVLAVLLAGLAAVLLKVLSGRLELADWLFVPLVVLPLALRRSRPRASAALIGAAALVQALLGVPIGFHDAAVLLGLATLGGWTDRRTGLVGLGGALVLVAVGVWREWWGYLNGRLGPDLPLAQALSTVGAVVLVGAAWAFGEQARRAREGDLAVRERAEQLERERSQLAELSAAAERTRIAREMHDVVAHGLTVMIVQADGASYALPPDADAPRSALLEIARTGRSALQEMRQLLGLLRAEDTEAAGRASVAPAPSLRRLDDLVAEARAAGAEVTLETEGELGDLSDLTSLTAYRVIQEALTNARRHGGPLVTVTVSRLRDELAVTVQDSGRDHADRNAAGPPGVGLTGLRERVTATGGRTRVGPVEGGGFSVAAWMPVSAAEQDAEPGREGAR
ncbi:sensor histidine kinase [uncultured Friedmanniella sp.]|uniref:sensor histidine kinase n=1 Tax=uncultured Friedmanniella sp. TaxID=335381 RepID=UPI0035CC64EB